MPNRDDTPFRIRRATPADARGVAKVHVDGWQWGYRGLLPDDYLDSLGETLDRRVATHTRWLEQEQTDQRTWVAEADGDILGFSITGPTRDEDALPGTGEVFAIYLRAESAGKGVGRALMAHAVDDLWRRGFEQAALWVLAANDRARRFYEAAGWSPDGATKIEERPHFLLHEMRYRIAAPTRATRRDEPAG